MREKTIPGSKESIANVSGTVNPVTAKYAWRCKQSGFTYIWLLIFVTLQGIALSVFAPSISIQMHREKEAELLFRGAQMKMALMAYAQGTPTGHSCRPQTLEDLLEDHRNGDVKRHLRRVYSDPFTGQMDWVLQRDAAGKIASFHSRALVPALNSIDFHRLDQTSPLVSDRVFIGAIAC